MRRLLALLALVASPALAEDSALERFDTMDDARGWEAVGRLEIEGKGFCTATLVAPDLVLTAAHCLFENDSLQRVSDDRMTFRAGYRDGRALASRVVRRSAIPAGYEFRGQSYTQNAPRDLALLQLVQPIRQAGLTPMAVAPALVTGEAVSIVSYAQGRETAPSMQESCGVMGAGDGIYVLTCSVDFGSSGAPVFQRGTDGALQVVSVVSAKAMVDDHPVAIGAPVTTLAELVAALDDPSFRAIAPGGVTVLNAGERNDVGARFVRP